MRDGFLLLAPAMALSTPEMLALMKRARIAEDLGYGSLSSSLIGFCHAFSLAQASSPELRAAILFIRGIASGRPQTGGKYGFALLINYMCSSQIGDHKRMQCGSGAGRSSDEADDQKAPSARRCETGQLLNEFIIAMLEEHNVIQEIEDDLSRLQRAAQEAKELAGLSADAVKARKDLFLASKEKKLFGIRGSPLPFAVNGFKDVVPNWVITKHGVVCRHRADLQKSSLDLIQGQLLAAAHAYMIHCEIYRHEREYEGVPCQLGAKRQRGANNKDVQEMIVRAIKEATERCRGIAKRVVDGELISCHGTMASFDREGDLFASFKFTSATFSGRNHKTDGSFEQGLYMQAENYDGFEFDAARHCSGFLSTLRGTLNSNIGLFCGMAWEMDLTCSTKDGKTDVTEKLGRRF